LQKRASEEYEEDIDSKEAEEERKEGCQEIVQLLELFEKKTN